MKVGSRSSPCVAHSYIHTASNSLFYDLQGKMQCVDAKRVCNSSPHALFTVLVPSLHLVMCPFYSEVTSPYVPLTSPVRVILNGKPGEHQWTACPLSSPSPNPTRARSQVIFPSRCQTSTSLSLKHAGTSCPRATGLRI